jgi:hypothetical protein
MTTPMLNNPTLFQSGQHVPFSHIYEMVGATDFLGKRKFRIFLNNDDRFPDYEGREVCWHMSSPENENVNHDKQTTVIIRV